MALRALRGAPLVTDSDVIAVLRAEQRQSLGHCFQMLKIIDPFAETDMFSIKLSWQKEKKVRGQLEHLPCTTTRIDMYLLFSVPISILVSTECKVSVIDRYLSEAASAAIK